MSIGSKVKRYREDMGLSQQDLAIQADIAQTTISCVEISTFITGNKAITVTIAKSTTK
ncbi:MAG: helix-turn-helix domain-containing protein [Flavobacteriaceae bacterium]|jgi:transcriptional regulator with XRE-family HTH domain|nr:helix-turn-helix domain-containing protein [Flavobacteriaceae bacterium]